LVISFKLHAADFGVVALAENTIRKPKEQVGGTRAPGVVKPNPGFLHVIGLISLLFCGSANAELAGVWALDDGTKLKASDLKHPLQNGNGIFKPKPLSISLVGARNEVISFQLILVGGRSSTSRTQVDLAAIGPIANQQVSSDPDRYFIGRKIELFLQHYHTVNQRSAALTWKPGSAAQPKGLDGPVPDALIPLNLLSGRAFDVKAKQNQGIWVDVYIPEQTPPGKHRGELTITIDGRSCGLPQCTIPIELDVIPATLPDEPSTKTMLWFSGANEDRNALLARYFKDFKGTSEARLEALRARHFKLARRHRITLFIGKGKKPSEALRKRLSGQAFSTQAGYAGPGEGIKQDLVSIHTYGGKLSPVEARQWHEWLAAHAPHATSFLYVRDEPPAAQLPEIGRIAKQARPVRSFVTTSYKPQLPIDIFGTPTSSYRTEHAQQAKTTNQEVWVYNGIRPFSGTFVIDDVAVSPRVNPWIQYKHKIPRWFYWESTYYNDFQGGRGQIDVWNQPDNFSNRDNDRLNGDGLLFWPGRDILFPKSDRGIDGPLPSIRLKNWRRGIQDVEYLVLARKAGHDKLVDQLLSALLPRTLDKAEAGAPISWPADGEKWLAARKMLATALSAAATGQAPPVPETIAALQATEEPTIHRLRRRAAAITERLGGRRLLILGGAGLTILLLISFGLFLWNKHRRSD